MGNIRKKGKTAAVLLAAGESTRFLNGKDGVKKPYVNVCGIPVIIRSVKAFESSDLIDEIIIVTGKDDINDCVDLIDQYQIKKIKCVVAGGRSRQESARIGFDAISETMRFVAIHDAARCLVTTRDIEKVIFEAYKTGAAIAAVRQTDTLKSSTKGHTVEKTIDRSTVWCAQTPQVFLSNLYRAAAYTAESKKLQVTDDASIVEHLGASVSLVECGKYNFKITDPVDVKIAELLFEEMELLLQ